MMNKKITIIALFFCLCGFSQSKLPNITLKNLDGKSVNISSFNKVENPVMINFWATWCAPCIKELKAISKYYPKWQEEFNLEIIAVSVDDAKTKNRVRPQVNGAGWKYTVLFDENLEFKQAMNVSNVPYSFLIYKGKIVYVHSGYTPGIENELYEKLKELN